MQVRSRAKLSGWLMEIPSGSGSRGKGYTVRLIGVDAPEAKHRTQAVEYFGREVSAFTKAHLEGKTVALERDRTGDTADRYGRLLRYGYLDGDNFNARLIRKGYAHAYRGASFSKRQEFIHLEEQARRRTGRGAAANLPKKNGLGEAFC